MPGFKPETPGVGKPCFFVKIPVKELLFFSKLSDNSR
jgi:hypothetical protein